MPARSQAEVPAPAQVANVPAPAKIVGRPAAGAWSPWSRLAGVAVLAAAMAHVEGVVVYYIGRFVKGLPSALSQPGFHFPQQYITVERSREAATMVILLAVGYLAGRTWPQKLAYYLFAFGCWDVCYYLSLRVLLHWPHSLGDRDLLFLMPTEWWGPVWEPVSISAAFIAVAVLILARTRRA